MTDGRRREAERNGVGEENGAEEGQVALSETTQGDSQERSGKTLGQKEAGFVYFLETWDSAFIKIGYSMKVEQRFQQVGTLLPELRLIGYIPGTRETESWLHQKFAQLRQRGEWFRHTNELRAFIGSALKDCAINPQSAIEESERARLRRLATADFIRQSAPETLAERALLFPGVSVAARKPYKRRKRDEDRDPVLFDMVEMGRKGGKNSRKNLTDEEKRELGQRAARARWGKKKKG